jgi:ferritin-like metal-binding protein YciE
MPVKDQKELFVWMLSDLRRGAEQTTTIFQELEKLAEDPVIKEALQARVFVHDQILSTLDECFRMIGQKPVNTKGRVHEIIAEDFRRELGDIENKDARRLFILAKANRVMHVRIADYEILIAASDLTGHYGVGALLQSCLASKLAFVERTRRLIRHRLEQRMAA